MGHEFLMMKMGVPGECDNWLLYRKTGLQEMRPYHYGMSMDEVSVSQADVNAGCPKLGGMIARNPDNHADMWYIAQAFFDKNYEKVIEIDTSQTEITPGVPERIYVDGDIVVATCPFACQARKQQGIVRLNGCLAYCPKGQQLAEWVEGTPQANPLACTEYKP